MTAQSAFGSLRRQHAFEKGCCGGACLATLGYDDVMITSGPLEGANHKIKTMKRQAYGFRYRVFFELKILAIHETKYALVG